MEVAFLGLGAAGFITDRTLCGGVAYRTQERSGGDGLGVAVMPVGFWSAELGVCVCVCVFCF